MAVFGNGAYHSPMRIGRAATLLAALLVGSVIACQKQPEPQVKTPDAKRQRDSAQPQDMWTKFVSDFQEAFFKAHPTFAVYQGRHEFDGQLPDWTPDGIHKWVTELRGWRDRAGAFQAESLDEKQKFERDYLV